MEEQNEIFINEYLYRLLLTFMESRDAEELAFALHRRVWDDIKETADEDNWTSADIDIALSRILRDTFCNNN